MNERIKINKVQCGLLDWIPEYKKDISGKTDDVEIKCSLVHRIAPIHANFLVLTNAPCYVRC